jgi:hypothetical protein
VITVYAETTLKQCFSSLFSSSPFTFPPWVQGSETPITVIPVQTLAQNSINNQIFTPYANGASWAIAVALGNGYLAPVAGQWFIQSGVNLTSGTIISGKYYYIETFVSGDNFTNVGAGANSTGCYFQATGSTPTTWTHGSALQESTMRLNYNAVAADVASALNTTAFVATAGGCVVIADGVDFIVTFDSSGAVTTMVGNGSGLAPLSIVIIGPILTGSTVTGVQSVQSIQLMQNPGAYQVLGNATPAAAITATRTAIGGTPSGTNETWTLVVDPRSFAGVFNILFTNAASAVQETVTMPYNTTDANMQTALQALGNIGANNCTVNQVAPWTYVIQFVGSLANTPINANAIAGVPAGLQVPLGRYDTLALTSAALGLIMNGATAASIKFEIDGTAPGSTEDYLYQASTSIIASIVPPFSETPAPSVLIDPGLINWPLLPASDPGPGKAWLNGSDVNVGP